MKKMQSDEFSFDLFKLAQAKWQQIGFCQK